MTPQQRIALEHHCRLAGETTHPRFMVVAGDFGINMTVNSGYE